MRRGANRLITFMTKAYRGMKNKANLAAGSGLVASIAEQPETVVVMISPCRSGSTAMLRVFGYAGFSAYFQPIKSVLRWRHLGEHRQWDMPRTPKVFLKETFGPYHEFEVAFDPIAALLQAGLAPKSLHLLVLLRDPATIWASWQAIWGNLTRLNYLEQSFQACINTSNTAQSAGIPIQIVDYQRCVSQPTQEIGAVFDTLGLVLKPGATSEWNAKPGFAQSGSGVIVPQEPDRYVLPSAHQRTVDSTAFGQVPAQVQPTDHDHIAIQNTAIPRHFEDLQNQIRVSVA